MCRNYVRIYSHMQRKVVKKSRGTKHRRHIENNTLYYGHLSTSMDDVQTTLFLLHACIIFYLVSCSLIELNYHQGWSIRLHPCVCYFKHGYGEHPYRHTFAIQGSFVYFRAPDGSTFPSLTGQGLAMEEQNSVNTIYNHGTFPNFRNPSGSF